MWFSCFKVPELDLYFSVGLFAFSLKGKEVTKPSFLTAMEADALTLVGEIFLASTKEAPSP